MRPAVPAWSLEHADGVLVARCSLLAALPDVRHAFSTRCSVDGAGDTGGFDLGGAQAPREISTRRERLVRAAGLGGSRLVALSQVHGRRVLCFERDEGGAGDEAAEADGVILLAPAGRLRVAAVRTADCVALLLADRRGRAVAALHAGWRGIAAGIVEAALGELDRRGIAGADLRVALGPAIGRCCYEVGPDVRREIERSIGEAAASLFTPLAGDRVALDLHAALALQLGRRGVEPAQVSAAPWCTLCRPDLFFSHRRERERAGRMMALVGLAPAA